MRGSTLPSPRKPLTLRWSNDLSDCVSDLRFSPDGSLLAVATLAGPVTVFEVEGGHIRYTLEGHRSGTLALAWSPDGTLLATGGQDGLARLCQARTGSVLAELKCGGLWVEHLAWSHNGSCLATAAGKTVRFFSPDAERLGEVSGHESTVTGLLWLPDRKRVVSSCYGGVQFLEVGPSQPVRRFPWKGSLLSLAVAPDGKYLAAGNQDASVHVWRTKTGEDFQMTGYPTKVKTLSFSDNSLSLATGAAHVILIWDFSGKGPAGKKPQILKGHTDIVTDLAFMREKGQRRLISVGLDGQLCTWAPHLSPRTVSATETGTSLVRLAVHPKEPLIAVGSRLGRATLFAL